MVKNPVDLVFKPFSNAAIAEAHQKSGELRFRRGEVRRDLTRQLKNLSNNKLVRAWGWLGDHAFSIFEHTDLMTSTPVWIAAYQAAKRANLAEADAVKQADDKVRQFFPSHHAVDLAPLLRDKGFVGMTVMFHGYFNQMLNVEMRLANEAGPGVVNKAKAAGKMLAVLMVSMVLAEFLSGRGAEAGDEPEDETDDTARSLLKWRNWFMRKMLGGTMSLVPGGGEVSRQVEQRILHPGKKFTASARNLDAFSVAGAIGDSVFEAAKNEDEAKARQKIEAIVRAAGPLTGLPTSQPIRTGDYLWQVLEDGEDGNAADVMSGLFYGQRRDQPANPFNIFGAVDKQKL
jgi:hypothetical protein